jgi:DNA-binding CsgD family transcriptional regulator
VTDGLTPRQAEIAALIADGLTNKEIARRLGLGVGTVKIHIAGIFERWDVRGRVGIVVRVVGPNGATARRARVWACCEY